jgi:hypothetical protein
MRQAGIEDMKQSIDSGVIQPAKNAQKSLDSWASESRVAGTTDLENNPSEGSSSDTNKIAPPAPKEEHIK